MISQTAVAICFEKNDKRKYLKMNKLYTLILLFVGSTLVGQGIQFEESKWQDALAKAKAENKLLFVDAYAQWCGPCKKMAKYEFTQEAVGSYYNTNFVNLKLDMETPNGRTFDSQYPVSAYPTMFFLDGDGNIVKKVRGGQKAAKLISMAQKVMATHDFSGDYREQYEEGARDYETVYNYVKALNQGKKPSLKISNEYLQSAPDITADQRLAFVAEAAVEADSKLYTELVDNRQAVIKLLGEEQYNALVRRACDNTVQKAVEYEYPDLLDEALAKSKQGLTSGAEGYELEARKMYAFAMRDQDSYLKATKALALLYLKEEPTAVAPLIDELIRSKKQTPASMEAAELIAKKYHKKEKTGASGLAYAKTVLLTKDYKKALKILEKTIRTEKKAGNDTKSLESFAKLVKNKMNS